MKDQTRKIWNFWIDRGGTFTDCIGLSPEGTYEVAKILSSDDAPVEGVREILSRFEEPEIGSCKVRMGTTVATNALLERRGVPTALFTNIGLGDVLEIGTQERPDLFSLQINKAEPLAKCVMEINGRVDHEGEDFEERDESEVRAKLRLARDMGIESVAILQMHAYQDSDWEERLGYLAREEGFDSISLSHEVAPELGFLSRGETTVADAYLSPLLRTHIRAFQATFPNADLKMMQSSGGLASAEKFSGPSALLSGPAGGVVGTSFVANQANQTKAIGFDMGGTSTDVSLVIDGTGERVFESVVAGIRVRSPMLDIHTVAAGGGSLCRFDGEKLTVGPESAGANPGPLCYGQVGQNGEILGREIALTDMNFWLDRVPEDRLPVSLLREPVETALGKIKKRLSESSFEMSFDEIAAGFIEIANANMAQAIQEVSVQKGVDPRDFALVGFGGAGGQHVCAVARLLGIQKILLHPYAGLLSAFGIGVSDCTWDQQKDAGRALLTETGRAPREVKRILTGLEKAGREELEEELATSDHRVTTQRLLDLRYVGTDSALTLKEPKGGDFRDAFEKMHKERFGYIRESRAIEVVTARVQARAPQIVPGQPALLRGPAAAPLREVVAWFPHVGRVGAEVYRRESLTAGQIIEGPAIVLDSASTIVIDPGFRGRLEENSLFELVDEGIPEGQGPREFETLDPVRLEVLGNRFMSIAERMGTVLRNTSISTNIKERLDYSCAVFDANGGLVANAPHIPVHLGAMSETVEAVCNEFSELCPGDVIVTNDPYKGGSHLPDVTVVAPVFIEENLSFFVGARGHHADIGGKAPGSMPADSKTLEEEGVLLRAFPLVRDGAFKESELRRRLSAGAYPARMPDDNVADLEAMIASVESGKTLLREMSMELGLSTLNMTMSQLQESAGRKVAAEIGKLGEGSHRHVDQMDDGTVLSVGLEVKGERLIIDFAGTGSAHAGNLNAPKAVVRAAVIYVLRALVDERIPLNGGCLDPVEILIPEGSLLNPPQNSAVVGGNVETSQRVVDVLLGAIGKVAASQGTMNNVAFGNEKFGYYETIGGGAGAGLGFHGASGVHTHMTNTRITDPEVLETRYPVILERFSLRRGSGGQGAFCGGDGLARQYRFLEPVTVSLLTERRNTAPYGLVGGEEGKKGKNFLQRAGQIEKPVGGRISLELAPGDRLRIESPGGGGYGFRA